MTINEAIKQYNKAQEEARAAEKAINEAREAQEAARVAAREAYQSIFKTDHNSEVFKRYEAAQAATAEARKKSNAAAAIAKAAGHNVLNVAANTLRAAILENPAKFSKPTHFKKFEEEVKNVTGARFYIDNSLSCSFYINYLDMTHGDNCAYICEKRNGQLIIDPERLAQNAAPEYTLKEIKKEARQAEKDAEKLRKAAAKLEELTKATKANYNTYIMYYLPDYHSGHFTESKYF